MADALPDEKPCTVTTARGFSVLYKNRLLYSKYNPEKPIQTTIQSLHILPGTLLLCCSPCLWYGLADLMQKLPADCLIAACEADSALYEFEKNHLTNLKKTLVLPDKRFLFLSPEQFAQFPFLLENPQQSDFLKIPLLRTFKRIMRIDFSAGVQFNTALYNKVFTQCQSVISQFWKNRLTLVRFGRLYSRNLFQNLARLEKENSFPLETVFQSITKPIIVCGTGGSLEKPLHALKTAGSGKRFIC